MSCSDRILDYGLKVVLGSFNIKCNRLLLNVWIAHYHHDICGICEFIYEGSELLVTNDHTLELEVSLDAGELELFDDVTDLFKAVHVFVALRVVMRDNQEGGSLEQYYFICIDSRAELLEVSFEDFYIGEEEVDNLGPGLVEGFIPNGGLETVYFEGLGLLNNLHPLLLETLLSH